MSDQQKYVNKLKGKTVLIIGGSSGIGFGVAEASLEYGARVIISSSSPERLAKAVDRLKAAYSSLSSRISSHPCDLGNEDTIESNISALFQAVGEVHHVVYSAGDSITPIPTPDLTLADLRKSALIREHGALLAAKEAAKYLPNTPESSFTITSGSSGEKPFAGWVYGSFVSGGHASMARGLALDLKPIRFNVIAPGVVDTEMWSMPEEQKQAIFRAMEMKTTTGRVAKVEDIAEAYLYVMRDTNVTGSLISTNGGSLLM